MAEQQPLPPTGSLATVLYFNPRRGYGMAIITKSGRRVRIPLSAMKAAKLLTLEPGAKVYVQVDGHDRTRVEALQLV